MGKLASEELQKLLACIRKNPQVIVPPLAGYDAGVHLIDAKCVVVSTDPCIGVPEEWFGWLLINYAASDVALFGTKPEFCTITLLAPLATEPQVFHSAMKQACAAADELSMAIVTGHTGTYNGLSALVGVCTAYGTAQPEKLITPGNAKPGDDILCTKPVGLETAVNFSLTRKALARKLFGAERAEELAGLVPMQSCVREALQLAESGCVHAMHDATEGGLAAALNELAEASAVGFTIEFEKVPVSSEVRTLQRSFKLTDEQVLSMSSTGTVLAAVKPEDKDRVTEMMRRIGLTASFPGEFTERKRRVLLKDRKQTRFPKIADDPYSRILSGKV